MAKSTRQNGAVRAPDNQLTLADVCCERVRMIPLAELFPPDIHPFRVQDDEQMTLLAESVKRFGVREPGLARPIASGADASGASYELLCGNRRKRACQLAGLTEMPVLVRDLSDDDAVIAMIDSNLQARERILPSERAFAYKMKMDALKRGPREHLRSWGVSHNGVKADRHSCEIMAEQTGESVPQIFRYIRLTELVEVLLDKVDARQLALTPAVELSHLSYSEQLTVAECMEKHDAKPSLSQAVRLKKLKQAGMLTADKIDALLAETKKPNEGKPKGALRFRKFFPPDYSQEQIESVIMELLRNWQSQMKPS